MESILTTGGLYTEEIRQAIFTTICRVLGCRKEEIESIQPVQEGMTNIVLSFEYNGGKYIYRHPGLGAEGLVDRGRESMMQKVVEDAGIDNTLIAMSVDEGWRISKFIESRKFDYHNLNDMVRAIMLLKKLHMSPSKVRWEFDVIKIAESIREKIPEDNYGAFEGFEDIRERIYKLNDLTHNDNIPWCNIHGDARDVNFLINNEEIYLIDWEYSGYGDPGFDIGSYICGGDHTEEEIEQILFIYFGREPKFNEKRHFYAYIGITGWFYLHWTMYKESCGQKIGVNKSLWYYFANEYSKIAIKMYEEAEK